MGLGHTRAMLFIENLRFVAISPQQRGRLVLEVLTTKKATIASARVYSEPTLVPCGNESSLILGLSLHAIKT